MIGVFGASLLVHATVYIYWGGYFCGCGGWF